MTDKEVLQKIKSVENIGGMTVNESLYACGLIKEFDKSMMSDKVLAEKILTHLAVDIESITLIINQNNK